MPWGKRPSINQQARMGTIVLRGMCEREWRERRLWRVRERACVNCCQMADYEMWRQARHESEVRVRNLVDQIRLREGRPRWCAAVGAFV